MTQNGKENGENVNIRKLALEVLLSVMEEGVFCDKAIHRAFAENTLEQRDRSFLTRLVEGTVERCIELDAIVNAFSKVKVNKMKPVIRTILRMAVYQIYYMEQVPDSAACNEAVKLTIKKKFVNLKGFVNGVLRTIIREKESFRLPYSSEKERVSLQYSMPEWIVERFLRDYGKRAETILQQFLAEKGMLHIRVNTSKYSVEEVRESLERQGVVVTPGNLFDYALTISKYGDITALEAFQKGMFQVQDESSMVAVAVAGIKKEDTVIDVCAAPGGKTLHAADRLCGTGKVYAADLSEQKVCLIQENALRNGFDNIEIYVNDATVLRNEWINQADVVIADLPCSGLGVIGKKCDIKYKTKEEDIVALSNIQKEILRTAGRYVKPGGKLVFSTCTIAPEENQENVAWITRNLDFCTVSIEELLPERLRGSTGTQGYIQILPDMAGTDGFFVSCYERKRR